MDEKKNSNGDDDAYVLEDDGASVEDIEHEMERTAQEAAGEVPPIGNEAAREADVTLGSETSELRDRYLRTLADFDNFRKRSEREKQDYFRFALADVLREILPVLDNFDRALEHAEQGDEFHRGVVLIYKQLFDVLQKWGLRVIEEAGVRFDPNIHEAVVTEENPDVPGHSVLQILQKGYFLNDRLLRPALVKVAVGGPEEHATS